MRSIRRSFLLLFVWFAATGSIAYAQSEKQAADSSGAASGAASEEEVQQLRREVAELKAQIQKLIQVQASAKESPGGAHLVQAAAADSSQPEDPSAAPPASAADIDALQKEIDLLQKKASDAPGPVAGWNGEHFFLKSPDGQFTLQPVGYLNAQYTFYKGDGAPSDTFSIRRARFGVQGSYGKQIDYAFLFETANTSSNGITARDMYVDFKPWNQFKIEGGQFKVPFSQEVGTGDTNVEFLERSIDTVLYPDAGGTFRAPGFMVHGDIDNGVLQYWGGAFNGKGLIANDTTNEPEFVTRVRFYPWRNHKGSMLRDFAVGGSYEHSRSRGLSNELSFSGVLNDSAYTFFPQFRINGGIDRYNGHFQWLYNRFGVRGEYTQILEKRTGVGSEQLGGLGFETLPGIIGKGAYGQFTYLLTGEMEPENAIPRVRHPLIGPPSPGEGGSPGLGAFQLKFRYSWLEGKAPGSQCTDATNPPCPITPVIFPTQSNHTDQFSFGVNWYLNYWILLKTDLNIDRLNTPSVQGITPQNYYVVLTGIQFRF
jgi:phosphate-selective porin